MPAKKAASKNSLILSKLKGNDDLVQSFTTPNGLSIVTRFGSPGTSTEGIAIEAEVISESTGQKTKFIPSEMAQVMAVLRLASPRLDKMCVFHGVYDGVEYGCNTCRADTMKQVQSDISRGAVVVEADE